MKQVFAFQLFLLSSTFINPPTGHNDVNVGMISQLSGVGMILRDAACYVANYVNRKITSSVPQDQAASLKTRLSTRCGVATARLSSKPLAENYCHTLRLVVFLEVLQEVQLMNKSPKIIPISDLRQNASGIIKSMAASHEPLFITQRGRATAVMVSMKDYEHTQHELEILRLLARGEKEIEAGIGFDLENVLADADAFLAEQR
jgi:prevent-host-death family protein